VGLNLVRGHRYRSRPRIWCTSSDDLSEVAQRVADRVTADLLRLPVAKAMDPGEQVSNGRVVRGGWSTCTKRP